MIIVFVLIVVGLLLAVPGIVDYLFSEDEPYELGLCYRWYSIPNIYSYIICWR